MFIAPLCALYYLRTYRARLWYRKRESGRIDPDVPVHVRKWARGRGARAKMVSRLARQWSFFVLVFSLQVSTPA